MHSCIYRGWVRHRRHEPSEHRFHYSLFMMYLDLAELPQLFQQRWFWSTTRMAPARFKRSDYHRAQAAPADQTLDEAVRTTVEQQTGKRPQGAIRLLTHLRYFGYIFNPVSFYYCFDAQGQLESVLAEITNTPWKQRHAYVLPVSSSIARPGRLHFRFDKSFHVSPFWQMQMQYDWHLSEPGEQLHIHMANLSQGPDGERRAFDATLRLRRQAITGGSLALALARHPVMTAEVTAGIYWQALRLWLRRTPFFANPQHSSARS